MSKTDNSYKYGQLPQNAPLGVAYVPMQRSVSPSYETMEALSRGTLFPGLDLPFMNIVNNSFKPGPMTELMAIDFVADELELYLDTHADDKEAFEMFQTFLVLKKEAHKRYVEKFGPIDQSDMLNMSGYAWLSSPWPWEYQSATEV